MQLINSFFRYSAILLFTLAAWIVLIAAIVIVSQWDGVLEHLLGA